MNDNEDIILVRDFKNGNEKSFDCIFEKYQIQVYGICLRFTRNEADARDICQDIFIKVYNNLKKFNEKSKFFTWLYRIAINTCISFKRKERRAISDYELRNPGLSLDKRIMMKIAIDDALKKLPERQRMAFILRHYEGFTFDEIGSIMRITTGAAKSNHFQAIRKLRVFLKDWV